MSDAGVRNLERIEELKDILEHLVLTYSHAEFCGYRIAGDYCSCMDRRYYNLEAVLIRAKKAINFND